VREAHQQRIIVDGAIRADDWTLMTLPALDEAVRKQAGKVVLFRLTGEKTHTPEQLAALEVLAGHVLLPLGLWQAQKDALTARVAAGEIGVCIDTHELVEDLVASCGDVNAFPVIAVRFERFADGRGYSIATLLRTRYGYRGQLRAVGDVLRDQLYLMKRCGFNAFAVRADRDLEVALAGLSDFSDPYQGAVDNPQPVWRRHARS
jgi:uncharacterized protein (DUF934 family)